MDTSPDSFTANHFLPYSFTANHFLPGARALIVGAWSTFQAPSSGSLGFWRRLTCYSIFSIYFLVTLSERLTSSYSVISRTDCHIIIWAFPSIACDVRDMSRLRRYLHTFRYDASYVVLVVARVICKSSLGSMQLLLRACHLWDVGHYIPEISWAGISCSLTIINGKRRKFPCLMYVAWANVSWKGWNQVDRFDVWVNHAVAQRHEMMLLRATAWVDLGA